jgi:SAM-dependent methyltransferase
MRTDNGPGSELAHRVCPACGADTPHQEISSDPPGEALPYAELRRYWSGLFDGRVFLSYARCAVCRLLYAPEFLTLDHLDELYANMAPNMALLTQGAIEATQHGYWQVAKRSGCLDGDYLEIGPDTGHIVRPAVAEGRFDRFWLFEPNRAVHAPLAEATAGRPHVISTDMEDLSKVPDGSVGLAVMVQVLDHLLDPGAMLARVRAKLKPDGKLIIVTHNEASLLRKVMGNNWPPFCLQHPQLYNPASLADLVRRAAYSRVRVERSKNYFPIEFMARQAAYTFGFKVARLPLPKAAIGLKLGNMIAIADR